MPAYNWPVSIYKCYDINGRLLYVGVSLDVEQRLKHHKNTSHWFWRVAKTTKEECEHRIAAMQVERRVILTEKPLYQHEAEGNWSMAEFKRTMRLIQAL